MRAVVQRVRDASVSVENTIVGAVDRGLLVYLGVEKGDTDTDLEYLVRKTVQLRIFDDEAGRMNLSVLQMHERDSAYGVLVISQFTLLGDTRKGNRPGYNSAEEPEIAEPMYDHFVRLVAGHGLPVATGAFGKEMDVAYHNDGPVTILMDTRNTGRG